MANRRRIGPLLVAALLGAVLAIGTHAEVARAEYAEVACAATAPAAARASAKAPAPATATAPARPRRLAATFAALRVARPPALHTPITRHLYLTRHALLI
jgi:hypothetical protein